ncbi:porin family protein [Chitinophaga horti]|uniref:Porin family protein n=1 Tax=Chitinophaga horti TaxID=2920382 RepID=A0ABY6J9V1_9BACT|nr:porin family protein [Chitinophaga horti]UYQ95084.1 porin family protein [Chitinophaga horti]
MKKVTIKMMMAGAFLLGMTQIANAQTKKTNFLSGDANFNSTKVDGSDAKDNSFGVGVQYGHFIKDNLALGLELGYAGGTVTESIGGVAGETKTSLFRVAPFARIEKQLWQTKFSVYSDLGIAASFGSDKFEAAAGGAEAETKVMGLGAFYRPGILFHLKDNIALLANFGELVSYQYTQEKVEGIDDKTSTQAFGINANKILDQFRFGIQLKF